MERDASTLLPSVEKIDSPIGDENCFAIILTIISFSRRENRFPDRGRELVFPEKLIVRAGQ